MVQRIVTTRRLGPLRAGRGPHRAPSPPDLLDVRAGARLHHLAAASSGRSTTPSRRWRTGPGSASTTTVSTWWASARSATTGEPRGCPAHLPPAAAAAAPVGPRDGPDRQGRGVLPSSARGRRPAPRSLLLLHGWTADADLQWFTLYDALTAAGYPFLAVDHRGHGRGLRSDAAVHPRSDRRRRRRARAGAAARPGRGRRLLDGWSRRPAPRPAPPRAGGRHGAGGDGARLPSRRDGSGRSGAPCRCSNPSSGRGCSGASPTGSSLGRWPTPPSSTSGCPGSSPRPGGAIPPPSPRRAGPSPTSTPGTWAGELAVPSAAVITTVDRLVAPEHQRALAERVGAAVVELEGDHQVFWSRPAEFAAAIRSAVDAVARPQAPDEPPELPRRPHGRACGGRRPWRPPSAGSAVEAVVEAGAQALDGVDEVFEALVEVLRRHDVGQGEPDAGHLAGQELGVGLGAGVDLAIDLGLLAGRARPGGSGPAGSAARRRRPATTAPA